MRCGLAALVRHGQTAERNTRQRSRRPHRPAGLTLLLRKSRDQARNESLNPDIFGEDDYSVIDGETCVGRTEMIQGNRMALIPADRARTAGEHRHDQLTGGGQGGVQAALRSGQRQGFAPAAVGPVARRRPPLQGEERSSLTSPVWERAADR